MWSAKYRAYGNLAALDIAEIDNPLRFQGQYFDAEMGLHYHRHRYYDPGTGRFLTPDPIKLAGGGANNYQYVPNPTGWVDPLGLSGECPGGANESGTHADPASKAKVNEGASAAPDPQWTNHGNKHVAPKAPWSNVVKSTANGGAAKYLPGTDIEALERHAFKNGQGVNNGQPWKVMDMGKTIGANDDKETRFMRIVLGANTIHGHPTSEDALKKLQK